MLAVAFLVLLVGVKVAQQSANLTLSGIDIGNGNVLAALVLALILPIVLDAILHSPACSGKIMAESLNVVLCFAVVVISALCAALYVGAEGVTVLILGCALWALLSCFSALGLDGKDVGKRLDVLGWVLFLAALNQVLLPHRELLLDITRMQKIQIVFEVALIGILVMALLSVRAQKSRV